MIEYQARSESTARAANHYAQEEPGVLVFEWSAGILTVMREDTGVPPDGGWP